MSEIRLSVANRALLQVPIFEEHRRGTNYMAVIGIDGSCPGGLSRQFVPRGRGVCLYLIEQVVLLDAVEFAADYTTSFGRKKRKRWYGVVIEITDDAMIFEQFDDGAAAVLFADACRAEQRAERAERSAAR